MNYFCLYKHCGEWAVMVRSTLDDAIHRARQYQMAGENDPGTYTETKVVSFDPDTVQTVLHQHVIVKQREIVQYNKRGAAKKEGSIKEPVAPWTATAYSTLVQQSIAHANPIVTQGS